VDFYERLASGGFVAGPPWFIWVLLAFDLVIALVMVPLWRLMPGVERLTLRLKEWPVATFFAMFVLSRLKPWGT